MRTVITFLVDTHSLAKGGSFKQPVWTDHWPTVVSRDNGSPIQYTSDQPVRASVGDQIIIRLQDASLGLYVELAPVMFLAHAWGPDGNNLRPLTPGDLADSNTDKPIDKPRFDVNHVNVPKMQYAGSESDWLQVESADHLCWPDGARIEEDASVTLATLYGPFVTFNFQSLPGVLEYGLEFALSRDGKTIEYYYFDPRIQVG